MKSCSLSCDKLREIIRNRWAETERVQHCNEGSMLGLPHPFIVPCAKQEFQEFYYWDSYFACRGLKLQGFDTLLKNCCDNFIYEVEEFGFIPNGNRTYYLNRSQPPFFGALLENMLDAADPAWLHRAFSALEKECMFWDSSRKLDCGLLHYGHHGSEEDIQSFYRDCCVGRLGMTADAASEEVRLHGEHTLAEAESGWDFNPRFERRCMDFAAIDLNSLMYLNEKLLENYYRSISSPRKSEEWRKRAESRKQLINRYCWNSERGIFMDYDALKQCHSPVFSAASLMPLWCGLADAGQSASSVRETEKRLECDYGLATCEPHESTFNYQWDYPNGWPPLQVIAIDALERYGYHVQARRIAQKYVDTVLRNYEKFGDIWEKYNVVDGSIEVSNEYAMPAMLGWSAGAFVVACDYLDLSEKAQLTRACSTPI